MTTNLVHTFRPSLQDISLKRFRLRYDSYYDCYYLHWDDNVCPPLARINGLRKGLYSSSGVTRCIDQENDEVYIGVGDDDKSGHLEWRLDFSSCGLVIMNMQLLLQTSHQGEGQEEGLVDLIVRGEDVLLTPQLGVWSNAADYCDLHELSGSSKVSITANIQAGSYGNQKPRLLTGGNGASPPLDVIIDLMCPRRREDIYCGEILLGIKFGPEPESDQPAGGSGVVPTCTEEGVAVECGPKEGQLQVHVVEGAGLVDHITHKPYKTLVKCNLLPDTGRFGSKHTTRKHNAYPTWTEEIVFNGVRKEELIHGGLEVSLIDHHHFSGDHSIGGFRMCIPRRKDEVSSYGFSASPEVSPVGSRCESPNSPFQSGSSSPSQHSEADPRCDITFRRPSTQFVLSRKEKSKSVPHIHQPAHNLFYSSPPSPSLAVSPTTPLAGSHGGRASASPVGGRGTPNRLSPNPFRSFDSDHNSPSSPTASQSSTTAMPRSPIALAKNFFKLSKVLSPRSSPKNSPKLGRRSVSTTEEDRESAFVHWWMEDVGEGERTHWTRVLEEEGEWVYFWHIIHYKLRHAA